MINLSTIKLYEIKNKKSNKNALISILKSENIEICLLNELDGLEYTCVRECSSNSVTGYSVKNKRVFIELENKKNINIFVSENLKKQILSLHREYAIQTLNKMNQKEAPNILISNNLDDILDLLNYIKDKNNKLIKEYNVLIDDTLYNEYKESINTYLPTTNRNDSIINRYSLVHIDYINKDNSNSNSNSLLKNISECYCIVSNILDDIKAIILTRDVKIVEENNKQRITIKDNKIINKPSKNKSNSSFKKQLYLLNNIKFFKFINVNNTDTDIEVEYVIAFTKEEAIKELVSEYKKELEYCDSLNEDDLTVYINPPTDDFDSNYFENELRKGTLLKLVEDNEAINNISNIDKYLICCDKCDNCNILISNQIYKILNMSNRSKLFDKDTKNIPLLISFGNNLRYKDINNKDYIKYVNVDIDEVLRNDIVKDDKIETVNDFLNMLKVYEIKYDSYTVNGTKELIVLGTSKQEVLNYIKRFKICGITNLQTYNIEIIEKNINSFIGLSINDNKNIITNVVVGLNSKEIVYLTKQAKKLLKIFYLYKKEEIDNSITKMIEILVSQ